ncbi:hypothetical protein SAMN05443247_03114 [Bradyrhizobium erythrophlei]|nr:hypothetical protein SAMN05443247_03114 [Bradyrhizobium erythrophlei]
MNYQPFPKSSTPKTSLSEKSSDEPLAFVDFILTLRIFPTPRGDLIALYKTLISARAFPTITTWPELYGFMSRRNARPEAIDEARKLWKQYQKLNPAAPPQPLQEREATP